jgi:hypothetical protein
MVLLSLRTVCYSIAASARNNISPLRNIITDHPLRDPGFAKRAAILG